MRLALIKHGEDQSCKSLRCKVKPALPLSEKGLCQLSFPFATSFSKTHKSLTIRFIIHTKTTPSRFSSSSLYPMPSNCFILAFPCFLQPDYTIGQIAPDCFALIQFDYISTFAPVVLNRLSLILVRSMDPHLHA